MRGTLADRTRVLPILVPDITLAQQRRAVPTPVLQVPVRPIRVLPVRAAPTIHAGQGTRARLRPVAPDTPPHLVRR